MDSRKARPRLVTTGGQGLVAPATGDAKLFFAGCPLVRRQWCAAPPRFRRQRCLLVLPALLLAGTSGTAGADALDTLNVTLSDSVMHDNNLFRLSSSVDPATVGLKQKSENINVSTVALKLAKNVSLQRFELEGSLVDYRYQTFDYLSFTASNYTAAWNWSLTPRFHGRISDSRTQSLNSFADYTGYNNRNLRTDEIKRFDGIFEFGPWQLLAGAAESRRTNSQVFLEDGDNTLTTVEGGLRRVFSSGASLSALSRRGNGDYFKRTQPIASGLYDNGFEQSEKELRLDWPFTGKSRLSARLGRLERQHDHYAVRDFAGTVGNVTLDWNISGKTQLSAGFTRELGSFQTSYSSYSQTDRLLVAPLWKIGAKTSLRLRYEYSRRDYLGAIVATPANGRSDTLRQTSISLEWAPVNAVLLVASLQGDKRASNIDGFDYNSTSANLTAQFSF